MLIDRYSNDKGLARALFLLIAPLGMQSKEIEAEAMRMVSHGRPILEVAHHLAGIEMTLRAVHGEELPELPEIPAPAPPLPKKANPPTRIDLLDEDMVARVKADVDARLRAKGLLANTRPATPKKRSDAG